ncbi:amidohydrolase [Campylobacter sp. 19-13652]|uniref:amidohydrolase n=1 Tax=Campylobacter sp. 19-13652 TaxID=2840180 RepID=UPI001C7513AA|nr:amidohydrolase [Campylobacter sp. 19-13652]BCX78964.1 p-aminobenzoyl-glutamate hydrolase subunit A [Campylobacter sp. 19-13652]
MKECLSRLRREFHAYPEAGWEEFYTTAKIIEYVKELDCFEILTQKECINESFLRGRDVDAVKASRQMALKNGAKEEIIDALGEITGCVCVFDSGRAGASIGLRFDIDCVCVSESKNPSHAPQKLGFASKNEGRMHSCGHDGHISIGLGVAKFISQNKHLLNGKIKLIFQPAEEGVRGGAAVANSGVLDDLDYLMACHIGFCAKSGEIVINPTNFLCTSKVDVKFKGLASHAGASPNEGKNALLAACFAVTQMHAISRHGAGMSRINVGRIEAGSGRNVIADSAKLEIEVRGETSQINAYMLERVRAIALSSAQAWDVECDIQIVGEACELENSKELTELLDGVLKDDKELKNRFSTVIKTREFNASEDATLLIRRVQECGGKACYFILGADIKAGHHSSDFDFDEGVLESGVMLYQKLLLKLLT